MYWRDSQQVTKASKRFRFSLGDILKNPPNSQITPEKRSSKKRCQSLGIFWHEQATGFFK
jgi:hypothetical protein